MHATCPAMVWKFWSKESPLDRLLRNQFPTNELTNIHSDTENCDSQHLCTNKDKIQREQSVCRLVGDKYIHATYIAVKNNTGICTVLSLRQALENCLYLTAASKKKIYIDIYTYIYSWECASAPWAGIAQSVQRLATGYGDRISVQARFSAPVQTGPGTYPASCTMGTGSFPG